MDFSILIILGIVVGVLAVMVIVTYNTIIRTRNNVEENVAAIDTIFQNRYDLIPNLVEVVKQYVSHEKSLLEGVIKLRSGAIAGQEMTKEVFEELMS